MGLFDNVADAVARGTAAAGRTGRAARLRTQATEVASRRKDLMAQLGESVYAELSADVRWRSGREELLGGISDADEELAQIAEQLADIDAQAQAAQLAARTYVCPQCGSRVSGSQRFCAGCGMPVQQIVSQTEEMVVQSVVSYADVCVACGAPLEEGDVFCMACGARQPGA